MHLCTTGPDVGAQVLALVGLQWLLRKSWGSPVLDKAGSSQLWQHCHKAQLSPAAKTAAPKENHSNRKAEAQQWGVRKKTCEK